MKLAYYSSHGNIQTESLDWTEAIQQIFIIIHGANRNADDYFCSLHAILQTHCNQHNFEPNEVLLLVPWFLSTNDRNITFENGGVPFRWDDNDVSGPWRYGANAILTSPSSNTTTVINDDNDISSFALLDHMISYILDSTNDDTNIGRKRFRNVHWLTIVGHSSGGQFVQRYSLVTPIWDNQRMKSIVANPSSYAYLTPMRHIDTEWRIPQPDEMIHCPNYHQWEWGIGNDLFPSTKHNTHTVPSYVQNKLLMYKSVHNLTMIFSKRDVTYLVGGLDVCTVPDSKQPYSGWCNSHGLETSCENMMQGSNRFERHYWYCTSLQYMNVTHRCLVVPGVGHDHSLMLSSNIGRHCIFGSIETPKIDVPSIREIH
jgi:pimeloyl-ACP methyl ester carboxylesterase